MTPERKQHRPCSSARFGSYHEALDFARSCTREVAGSALPLPAVSVCFLTYNHAPFVRQALDSVLEQQTDFLFEIVIGDDASTDGTTDILKEYQSRHPDRIRLLLATENLGKYTGTGRLNFFRTLNACRGRYVAFLEGDDYWLDSLKLSKQTALLETFPETSGCIHRGLRLFEEDKGRAPEVDGSWPGKTRLFSRDTLDHTRMFAPTGSLVFRNILRDFPDFCVWTQMLDRFLFTELACHGPLLVLDDVSSVYRKHKGGVTSGHRQDRVVWDRVSMFRYFYRRLTECERSYCLAAWRRFLTVWVCLTVLPPTTRFPRPSGLVRVLVMLCQPSTFLMLCRALWSRLMGKLPVYP